MSRKEGDSETTTVAINEYYRWSEEFIRTVDNYSDQISTMLENKQPCQIELNVGNSDTKVEETVLLQLFEKWQGYLRDAKVKYAAKQQTLPNDLAVRFLLP